MENEVSVEKKKGKGIYVLVALLILIIVGLCCFIAVDKNVINLDDNKTNTVESNNKVESEKAIDLDINDVNVIRLYDNVHKGGCVLENYYSMDKLTSEDMSIEQKYDLAFKLAVGKELRAEINGVFINTIYEKDIKNDFESIFGSGSYKRVDSFEIYGLTYKFDSTKNAYVSEGVGCGGTCMPNQFEKIIGAKKYSDRIEITSVAVFQFSDPANKNVSLYRDSEQKEIIKTYDLHMTTDELNNYVDENKDHLQQFTYTYKIGENGFYHFSQIEKTNK